MNLSFIDSHAHIYSEEYHNILDDTIKRSLNAKVSKILMPNINLKTLSSMLKISEKYKGICFHMLGLHPCYVTENYKNEIVEIFKFLSYKTIAVGEIGLDFYRSSDNKHDQITSFEIQCQIALENNLPIVVHTRSSIDETLDCIRNFSKKLKGVFHCFDGTLDQAHQIIDLGFKIGVGGILTFKNSKVREVISKIDLNHIILETDSPYLSPEPRRGKTNEPSNLIFVSKKLSEITSIPIDSIAKITTQNAINLFDLVV